MTDTESQTKQEHSPNLALRVLELNSPGFLFCFVVIVVFGGFVFGWFFFFKSVPLNAKETCEKESVTIIE